MGELDRLQRIRENYPDTSGEWWLITAMIDLELYLPKEDIVKDIWRAIDRFQRNDKLHG